MNGEKKAAMRSGCRERTALHQARCEGFVSFVIKAVGKTKNFKQVNNDFLKIVLGLV